MRKGALILAFVISFTLPTAVLAASFKVYPGAKVEEIYEANQTETGTKMQQTPKVIIFITNDFFENVVAFYRGTGKEYRLPGTSGQPTKLPSGQELKEAYFIFDDALDIRTSKHWIKIQRPYLGRSQTRNGIHGKEVTAIIEEDKRTYP